MISWGWTAVYTAAAHSECDLDRVKIGPLLCKWTCSLCVQEELVQCLHAVNLLPQPSHAGVRAVAALGSTLRTPTCNQLVASFLLTHLWVIGRHRQHKNARLLVHCLRDCLLALCVLCVCEICRELFSPYCVRIICSPSKSHNHYSHTSALWPHRLHSQLSSLFTASYRLCSDRQLLLECTTLLRYPLKSTIHSKLFLFPHTITMCSWFSHRERDTSVYVTEFLLTIAYKPTTIER